jgi:hypothetical protein
LRFRFGNVFRRSDRVFQGGLGKFFCNGWLGHVTPLR